ncbi:MAG: hypothetical protein K2O95_06845 [Clostridia bacterium]|nr:hypothetical protein [Clostridia bacterium]
MKEKINKINLINLIIICIIFILELTPNSMILTWSNGPGRAPNIVYTSYLMDLDMLLWGIAFLTYFIALSTLFLIIFNALILYEYNTKLTIMSLVGSSLCFVGSVLLVALKQRYVSLQNIVITLLFLVQIITLSVNLRSNAIEEKLNSKTEE